jgi:hypothetical protein
MSVLPGGAFEVALYDQNFFTNASNDDLLVRTMLKNQRILIGTNSNQDAAITVTSNVVSMYNNLGIGTGLGNVSEALSIVGNMKASSNIYSLGKISIGASNPTVSLEVASTDSMLIPKGSTAQRPSVPVQGYIRYNTTLNTFEGYGAGNAWGSLGGVKDTNQDTYISAETFPTSNDDTLRFLNSNIETMRITVAGCVGISNVSPSERLEVSGGNAKFGSNVYALSRLGVASSNPSETVDAIGNIKASSNVYSLYRLGVGTSNPKVTVHINGSDAIMLPSGRTVDRPSAPVQGLMRYNTDINSFEGYGAGNAWGSLGGVKDTNQDTYISPETFPTSNDDTLRFFNSNVETMRITSNGFIGVSNANPSERFDLSGGNAKFGSNIYITSRLGIATTIPSESLHVSGNAKVTSNAFIMSNLGVGTSNPSVPLEVSGIAKFNSNVYMLSNLGIGTATPSATLEVSGLAKFNSNVTILSNLAVGTANPTATLEVSGMAKFNSNLYVLSNLGVGIINPSVPLEVSGIAKFNSNVYMLSNLGIGITTPSTTLEVSGMAKFNSNIYVMSNLGIGTSNPSSFLHIQSQRAAIGSTVDTIPYIKVVKTGMSNYDSAGIQLGQGTGDYNTGSLQYFNGAGAVWSYMTLGLDSTQNGLLMGYNGNSNNASTTLNGKSFVNFSTNNVERMRIDSSGNVGVGTVNPTSLLEVSGLAKFNSNVYVLSNLGIGTTTPTVPLEVNGSAKINSNLEVLGNLTLRGTTTTIDSTTINIKDNMITLNNGAAYTSGLQAGIEINRGTGYCNYYFVFDEPSTLFKVGMQGSLQAVATRDDTVSSNAIPFYNASNYRFTACNNFVYSNNNLGIGTSTPTEALEVTRNAKVNSNLYVVNYIGVGKTNPGESIDIVGNIKASSNIYALNRLGVGTSTPAVSFEVSGTDAVLLPKGTTAQRPSGPTQGHLRYNTTFNIFEGYGACNAWGSLGGVKDTNQDTYISAELFPTNNDDILRFFNSNSETMRLAANGFLGLSNQAPSERLEVSGGNAKFNSNVYVMSRLSINATNPQVGLEVKTTDAALIPQGTTAQRPSVPAQGHIRYNTTLNTFEGYGAGNAWGSLGGVKDTNQDTYISAESAPTNNDDNLVFYCSNVERMRITRAGNVGLGTNAPAYILDINSNTPKVRIQSSTNTNGQDPSLSLWNTTTQVFNTGYSHSGSYTYMQNSNSDVIRIYNTGLAHFTSNVGIGTTTPATPLEVNGIIATKNTSTPEYRLINANTSTNTIIGMATSAGQYSTSAQINDLVIRNDGATAAIHLQVGTGVSTITINSNDNVGINTAAPQYRLHVNGTGYYGEDLTLNSNLYVQRSLIMQGVRIRKNPGTGGQANLSPISVPGVSNDSALNLNIYNAGTSPSNSIVFFGNTNNEIARFTNAGNLGIGLSNPLSSIHIQSTAPTITMQNNTHGNTQLRFLHSNSTLNAEFGVFDGSNVFIANKRAGNITFETNSVERMRINSNGFVGIGTQAPSNALDVVGVVDATRGLIVNPTSITPTFAGNQFYTFVQAPTGSNAFYSGDVYSDTGFAIGIDTSDKDNTNKSKLKFMFGSSAGNFLTSAARMTFDNNGNIGIGNSNPLYRLDVAGGMRVVQDGSAGSLRIGPFNAGSEASIGFYNTSNLAGSGTGAFWVMGQNSYNVGASNFAIGCQTTGHTMAILSNGNVGMGTLTPGYKLDVSGDLATTNFVLRNSFSSTGDYTIFNKVNGMANTKGLIRMDQAGQLQLQSADTQNILLQTSNVVRMTVNGSTGNVGIGTSSPAYSLDVNGVAKCSNIVFGTYGVLRNDGDYTTRVNMLDSNTNSTEIAIGHDATANNNFTIGYRNGTAAGNRTGSVSNYLYISPWGTSPTAVFTAGGNVGVGTTTPGYKMDVFGLTRFVQDGNAGSIRITPATPGQEASIGFYNTSNMNGSGAGAFWVMGHSSFGVGASNFAIGCQTTGQTMSILSNGNVGVGTLTPAQKLDVSGKVQASQGWAGTGSSAGLLGGTIMTIFCERNGTTSVGDRLAWGNGSSTAVGLRMPFAGKIHFATLNVSSYTSGSATFGIRITNSSGTSTLSTSSYITTVSNTTGSSSDWRSSPLAFAAGDRICCECTALTATTATVFNMVLWYSFD